VPTSRKACVGSGDAAHHNARWSGTIMGHRLTAMPIYDIPNNPTAPANGSAGHWAATEPPLRAGQQDPRWDPEMTGMGDSGAIFGQQNQRLAICGCFGEAVAAMSSLAQEAA